MKFLWADFGILDKPEEDTFYLYAINTSGEKRKISKRKYKNWPYILKKIELLYNKPCILRTSQNTGDWKSSEWFSDITLKEGNDQINPPVIENDSNVEAIEILNEKIKKLNDKNLDLEAENNNLKNENAEIILINAKLQAEFDDLSNVEKDVVLDETKILDEMKLDSTTQAVTVRGHPRRLLALRLGILLEENRKRVEIKILKKRKLNLYEVEFIHFSNIIGIVALGFDKDKKSIYAKSFTNLNLNWFNDFKKITGLDEVSIKDRTDLGLTDLYKIFKEMSDYYNANRR